MSWSPKAVLVVGVKIKRKDLYTVTLVPECLHSIPEGANFCPKCGKSAKSESSKEIDGFNELKNTYYGHPIIYISEENDMVLGKPLSIADADEQYKRLDTDFILKTVEETRNSLKDWPIFKEKNFGIWLAVV